MYLEKYYKLDKLNVTFRVDIGEYSGLGHFYRCFALAEIIASIADIKFSLPIISPHISNILNKRQFSYETIVCSSLFIENLGKNSVVVLDGYNFSLDLQKNIIERNHHLILLDDKPHVNYYANAIINSDPYVKSENYKIRGLGKLFLGLNYMISRPSFFENRNNYEKKIEKVWIISFGGTSNLPLYLKYLSLIDEFNKSIFKICEKITVILNNSSVDFDQLNLFISTNELSFKVEILQSLSAEELITIMDEAKYAILPGSGILREAVLRNVFCLTGYFVDNQKPIAMYLNEVNIAINVLNFTEVDFSVFSKSILALSRFGEYEYKKINLIFAVNQIQNIKSIFRSIKI